jgi:hypothetical protein
MEKVGVWRGPSGGDFEVVNDYITIIRRIIRQITRYPRIASVTTRRAGKSDFRLLGIVITQHSHIFER